MPSTLSIDLREGVVAAIEAGASRGAAAKRFGVGAASAIRWHEQFREDGQVAPKPMGGDQRSRAIYMQAARVGALYEARSESFLREVRDALAADGVVTSNERPVALLPAPRHHAQRKTTHAAERERSGVKAARPN